ncbi:MAG: aldolase [Rhodobacterales bacterium]|nr:MAG: aldolase [Rhodobacterales bacterium]
MNSFDEREQAFESKYAHDQDMQFKAAARTNKLLGFWAAEKLGKTGDAAEAYAKEVVISDLDEPGHEDVVRKVAADLGDKSSADEIRSKMNELRREAKKQVMKEA